MTNKNDAVVLGEWSNIAVVKHTRKILKHEAGVLKDKDPEELHQMRVGIRRLRSAIVGFNIALDLPEVVNEKNIGKIGKKLGKLRDLDVLLAALENDYRSLLPKAEQKSLDKAITSLQKQRKQALKQVKETLNSGLYLDLKQALLEWWDNPKYQAIADISIYSVLPDLLLPQISNLLLHPGWLVGIKVKKGEIHFPKQLDKESVRQLLEKQEKILHDLRKEAKRSRYNLELFTHFYGDKYQHLVKQIKLLQEVLGNIQDCYVLREVLEKLLQSKISSQMPKLAALLTKTRYQQWQQWSILQQQFCDRKNQHQLRLTIIDGQWITKTD